MSAQRDSLEKTQNQANNAQRDSLGCCQVGGVEDVPPLEVELAKIDESIDFLVNAITILEKKLNNVLHPRYWEEKGMKYPVEEASVHSPLVNELHRHNERINECKKYVDEIRLNIEV